MSTDKHDSKLKIWDSVKLGSRVRWRTATGELYPAMVIGFTHPTARIRVRNDTTKSEMEIWIEQIEEVDAMSTEGAPHWTQRAAGALHGAGLLTYSSLRSDELLARVAGIIQANAPTIAKEHDMSTDKHSPTPWTYDRERCQIRATDKLGYGIMVANLVSLLPDQHAPETVVLTVDKIHQNGERILQAVNAHDELMTACEACSIAIAQLLENHDDICNDLGEPCLPALIEAEVLATSAFAKARP